MSRVTKAQKQHRVEREARQRRRERTWVASRRHLRPVLKRPPKWMRHLAQRDPLFRSLSWRALGGGALSGVPGAGAKAR